MNKEKQSAVFQKLCRAKNPNSQFTKRATWPVPSVGFATGGVIERGRAAMGSSASSSGAGPSYGVDTFGGVAQPRTYAPLTVDWPQESGEWSLVTDDEEDDDGPREKP